ncbi:heterokaryon incompatibility protein-domain-containing protein [Immersiella caudata]|uniref:Heterokaryon incompatibility protein-domain-containing protein n=1 Tax=Immersiella caudata TaxID=314043 RepID=A0AA40BZV4_9PEZI|nr:heterokaryon incompatibility protein-domain-containing protein [Immersiella caudata]
MTPQAAQLCERCRFLEFNDKNEGGEVAARRNGEEYLVLPKRWYSQADGPGFWVIRVPGDDYTDTLPSLPGLEVSARSCGFCAFLRQTILVQAANDAVAPVEGTRAFLNQQSECSFDVYWIWFSEGIEKYDLPLGLLCLKVDIRITGGDDILTVTFGAEAIETPSPGGGSDDLDVSSWLRIPPGLTLTDWMADEDSVRWARGVIDWCSSDHGHATESFRPKRLIEIGDNSIKLVRSDSFDQPPDYAALSYCWGSEVEARAQLKTDSSEAELRFSTAIDEQRLPRAVKDAVATARALSMPYLWVDALCVRQDQRGPGEDWEEHAGLTDKIYGNSTVTIGALAASSCQESFLVPQPAVYINYRSSLRPKVAGMLKLDFVDILMNDNLGNHNSPQTQVLWANTLGKWNMRGWTDVEQLSSTRFLGFGRRNLIISCPYGSFYREGPLTSFHSLSQYGLERTRLLSQMDKTVGSLEEEEGVNEENGSGGAVWRQIVGWYSARTGKFHNRPPGFSDMTDTFHALSSMARSYAAAAGFPESDYAAGLWRQSMPGDLLWTMNDPHAAIAPDLDSLLLVSYAEPYIAPSWSWANRGKVSFDLLNDDDGNRYTLMPGYDRLKPHVVHRGADPLGAITHAELRITALIADIPSPHMVTVEREELTVTITMTGYKPRIWVLVTESGDHLWQFNLDWDPEGKLEDPFGLRMLVLGWFDMAAEGQSGLAGLLVAGVEGGKGNTRAYKRVGVFRSVDGEQPRGSVDRFLAGAEQERLVLL